MEDNNQSVQNVDQDFSSTGNTPNEDGQPKNLIASFFAPMTQAQKVLFGLVSVFLVALVGMILYWASRPDYTLLFGNLSPAVSQEIVMQLKDEGINYQLESEGSAILVPRSEVYDLRLRFAAQGTSSNQDVTGYELFDNSNLGMTDFMQKVNMQRALEGELARTISSMDQIAYARVHLVIPERSPFAEQESNPSASVYLTMNGKVKLTETQLVGIQSLVAGAVEGLSNENVTLIDGRGNRLTENNDLESIGAITNSQMKHQQETEQYLTNKAQSMLDKVLGAGNAIVRITTEHDFDKVERISKLIDPESRVIISENIVTENEEDRESDPLLYDEYIPQELRGESVDTRVNTQESTNETKNYDLNRTEETFEKPIGVISRISASVLLNYQRNTYKDVDGKDSLVYEPYTPEQLQEIEEVISSAIGLKIDRGDVITITQRHFDNSDEMMLEEQQREFERQQMINQIVRWTLIIIAFMGSVGVLFFLYRRSVEEVQEEPIFLEQDEDGRMITDGTSPDVEYDDAPPSVDPEVQAALRRKEKMIDAIKDFVMSNPAEAASIIRTWMKQKPAKANQLID